MKLQLYLPEIDRRFLRHQINQFVDFFLIKLHPMSETFDAEAEEFGEDYFNSSGGYFDPDTFDPGDFAEQAMERSVDHYLFLNYGKYVLTASWHVALYEAFEQQVREYIHRQLSFYIDISLKETPWQFADHKKIFNLFGIDLKGLKGLKGINELRLLCNVIKHGEGISAVELRKKRPDLIENYGNKDLLELHGSSLMKEVLLIDENTLKTFGNDIIDFWNSLPERSYNNDRDKLLKLLNR